MGLWFSASVGAAVQDVEDTINEWVDMFIESWDEFLDELEVVAEEYNEMITERYEMSAEIENSPNFIGPGMTDRPLEDYLIFYTRQDAKPVYVQLESIFNDLYASFKDIFLSISTTICPVDTGYLRSTIHCTVSGGDFDCSADADYAEYVEFGTWKMAAQPYFEPAIYSAAMSFWESTLSRMSDVADQWNTMQQSSIIESAEKMKTDVPEQEPWNEQITIGTMQFLEAIRDFADAIALGGACIIGDELFYNMDMGIGQEA